MALMESIARDGLTTIPILVSPTDGDRWIVRDGNRRVTAIKLLNNPDLAPDQRLKTRVRALVKTYKNNIEGKLDVLASDNDESILQEVVARHSGAQGGIGQLDWSAYLRTVYLVNHGHPAEYKRAAQYVFWAEEQGVSVEDEFPITTVHRFFTKENLEALGFKIVDDELQLTLSASQAKAVAQRVIMDFQLGTMKVDDVRSPAQASSYIMSVRSAAGLPPPTPPRSTSGGDRPAKMSGDASRAGSSGSAGPTPTAPGPTDAPSGSTGDRTAPSADSGVSSSARTPRKSPADRKCIFGTRSPSIGISADEVKAIQIVTELRKLDVRESPLATLMLLRYLIEASADHHRKRYRLPDQGVLSKNILASATRMQSKGELSNSQFDMVKALSTKDVPAGLIHIDTLQKMMHRDTHIPDYLVVNTFWDNISDFVRTCWLK